MYVHTYDSNITASVVRLAYIIINSNSITFLIDLSESCLLPVVHSL